MSRRTLAAYKSALTYVHENILCLNAMAIITDFERALRNALRKVVVGITLLGCWFHHCQALERKVASNFELFVLIRNNIRAKEIYRRIQCLALLPADKIKPAFDGLAFDALNEFPQFKRFIEYYDRQWINNETPESYSVFLQVCLYYHFVKFIEFKTFFF